MGQGSYTDGDGLVFERVFFAIERRHQDLPAELNDFTENLECLALFLIRRAQEKGPYRLLGRDIPPSDAWKKYESERITQVAAKNVKSTCDPSLNLLLNGFSYHFLHFALLNQRLRLL